MAKDATTFQPDPSVHADSPPGVLKHCKVCNPEPARPPSGGVVYQLGGVWGPDVAKSISPTPEDLVYVPRSYEEKYGKRDELKRQLELAKQAEHAAKFSFDALYGASLLRERDPQKLRDDLDAAQRKAEKK